MIRSIQQGLLDDGVSVPVTKLCRWFEVPRRTVYWERVTHVEIRPREYHEAQNGPPIPASADGINEPNGEGPIVIWKPYLEHYKDTELGQLIILHEAYHFTDPFWTKWRLSSKLYSSTPQTFCMKEKDINRAVDASADRLVGGGQLGSYPC